MPLRLIIKNTPSDEIEPMPRHSASDFIDSALNMAKNSNAKTRSAILADVCDVLNCRNEDLSFLFDHQAVPSRKRHVLGLELPDYRMSQNEIYKEAAE